MKVNFRRLVSVFCSLAMCAALLPAAVLAGDQEVAEMDGTTYPTLQAAVDAVKTDPATITLLDNTNETVTVEAGKNITLDLKGKTVTGKDNAAVLVNGGSLTVKDSTVTAEPVVSDDYKTVTYTSGVLEAGAGKQHAVQVYNSGTFVLESGTVSSTGNCGIYAGATGSGSGTATINGGYVHAREYGVGAINEGTTLNINGGVIVADDNAAVAGNGSEGLGGTTININGGTMISKLITNGYITCGVYHPQSGTLNINGGTIVSTNAWVCSCAAASANIHRPHHHRYRHRRGQGRRQHRSERPLRRSVRYPERLSRPGRRQRCFHQRQRFRHCG